MNHKIKFILLVIMLFLSGCHSKHTTSYISYTQTRKENNKLISAVYHYDLKNKPEKIYEFEYNSGYPLGVYDKKHNSVYYTQKMDGKNMLLRYNVKDKNVTVLTRQTTAVNDIIPIKDDKLFITSYDVKESTNVVYPFIYDLKNNNLQRLNLEPLISITDVKYDVNSNTIFLSGWLRAEEEKILQQKEGYNIPLQRNIYMYSLDTNKLELVYEGDSEFNAFGVDFKNKNIIVENKEGEFIRYNYVSKQSVTNPFPLNNQLVFIEGESSYYISEHLNYRTGNNTIKISEFITQEIVNNGVYITQ